jgi:hypothetical protein
VTYATIFVKLVESDIRFLQKDLDGAEKLLQLASAESKKHDIRNFLWRSQYGLGRVFLTQGRTDEAISRFKNALEYVLKIPAGVQRAEFSSDSISQASPESLYEFYISALSRSGLDQAALNTSMAFEASGSKEELGTPDLPSQNYAEILLGSSRNDALAVSYFIGKSETFIFIATNGQIKSRILNFNKQKLSTLLLNYSSTDTATSEKARDELSEELLSPIDKYMTSKNILNLISTKQIAAVPFAGLNLRGKDLIDTVAFSIKPLNSSPSSGTDTPNSGRYMKVLGVLMPQDKASFLNKERVILPRFFPDALILSDENLGLEKVKTSLAGKELLHISGRYQEQSGELRRSKLFFSRKNQKSGFFDIQTIANSRNTTNGVFIAQPSKDGVLASAFLASGASWVIANNAPQYDNDTLFLTKSFYNAFQKSGDPCSALRLAQLKTKQFIPSSRAWSYFKLFGTCSGKTAQTEGP